MGSVLRKLLIIIFSSTGSLVWAEAFLDDFNRAEVSRTASAASIGSGYEITAVTGVGAFQIIGNQLALGGGAGAHNVLSYHETAALNTTGKSVRITVEVALGAVNNAINPGIAFNFQDAQNFNFIRISTGTAIGSGWLQFGQVIDGKVSTSGIINNLNIQLETVYTLTVVVDAAKGVVYSLAGGELNRSGKAKYEKRNFITGCAGIYQNNGNTKTRFDNFSVTLEE